MKNYCPLSQKYLLPNKKSTIVLQLFWFGCTIPNIAQKMQMFRDTTFFITLNFKGMLYNTLLKAQTLTKIIETSILS